MKDKIPMEEVEESRLTKTNTGNRLGTFEESLAMSAKRSITGRRVWPIEI